MRFQVERNVMFLILTLIILLWLPPSTSFRG